MLPESNIILLIDILAAWKLLAQRFKYRGPFKMLDDTIKLLLNQNARMVFLLIQN